MFKKNLLLKCALKWSRYGFSLYVLVWKVGNISSSDTIYDVWGWLIFSNFEFSLLEANIGNFVLNWPIQSPFGIFGVKIILTRHFI